MTKKKVANFIMDCQNQVGMICARFAAHREDWQDLTQEVFLRLCRYHRRFDGEKGKVKDWVQTVAWRIGIDYYRARQRRYQVFGPEVLDDVTGLLVCSDTPESILLTKERHERLMRDLMGLSPTIRRVVNLRLIGYTFDEIADRLRIPIGTVKSRMNRGKEQLLKTYGVDSVKL